MILKLKRTPGIYLVGFMASGKSTIGRLLADRIGWSFFDVDQEIEAREGQAIAKIFAEQGELAFRDLEAKIIRRKINAIEAGVPTVVALGGGAFVQPQNWELIQNNGVTVWLDCPLHIVHRRLGDDQTRPLAANRSGLQELFDTRRPLYARADYRIEICSDDEIEAIEKILRLPFF